MASKRSRAAFEADLQAQESPYVFYGTPLPPLDSNSRDDGSYVPLWKQTVTDERGRRRLHGAFTGGFSAGYGVHSALRAHILMPHSYFNTVGSKEGWTPSTFVSSKSNRWKDSGSKQQKAEDFMDDEDLAAAEEARQVSTKESFSGLGTTEDELAKRAPLMDLFRPSGDTMGVKLLRKMGWRDGQGIGPKVRRAAKLDEACDTGVNGEDKHLFAPKNSKMISFTRKDDRKGLGFQGSEKLEAIRGRESKDSDEEVQTLSNSKKPKKKSASRKSGFGVGVLNDTGSDDEDPYSLGPKISYNKVIMGGDKNKKRKQETKRNTSNSNPLLHNRPVFVSKSVGRNSTGFRKCHDGRLPLEGFILSTSIPVIQENRYPPPTIPEGWKSLRSKLSASQNESRYRSTTDMAKPSTLDPSSRGTILGEASLPGKSVFDFMKPEARARIVGLTKNEFLPAAGSEAPESIDADLASLIPLLDPALAAAALSRGVTGFVPYADSPAKLERYRAFLAYRAKISDAVPTQPMELKRDEWQRELHEFAHAATIFKPMTGAMASRFTSGSSGPQTSANPTSKGEDEKLLTTSTLQPKDPAEEAAAMGMFGPMTRSSTFFYPSRLLCKRFNVPVPTHVHPENEGTGVAANSMSSAALTQISPFGSRFQSSGFQTTESRIKVARTETGTEMDTTAGSSPPMESKTEADSAPTVDPERNEALEAARPGEEVFRAIFGSDSEDD